MKRSSIFAIIVGIATALSVSAHSAHMQCTPQAVQTVQGPSVQVIGQGQETNHNQTGRK